MNWIDAVLVVLLLASVIVGSKKGLIRELMAFVVFFVAVIVTVNYSDRFAVWVHQQLGGSPLTTAFISFVFLLAIAYAAFKLLGLVFYKVASVKQVSKKDNMGGALIGFVRGWVAVGFLTFLVFLLPMPDSFYTAFETSFFGPAVAKTVPLMFDSTAKVHPNSPNFIGQIEKTLMLSETQGGDQMDGERVAVHRVLYQMERHFSSGISEP